MILILDHFHLLTGHYAVRLGPGAIAALGLAKSYQHRKDPGIVLWGAMAIFGLLLVGHRFHCVPWNVSDFWPVLVALWGVSMIARAFSPRPDRWPLSVRELAGRLPRGSEFGSAARATPDASGAAVARAPGADPDSVLDLLTIFGGTERSVVTADFRGGRITAIMGGVAVDLRQAVIAGGSGDSLLPDGVAPRNADPFVEPFPVAGPSGEATLEVLGLWGGIELRVPADWKVVLEVTPILGSVVAEPRPAEDRRQTLVVRGTVFMGGIEVRS